MLSFGAMDFFFFFLNKRGKWPSRGLRSPAISRRVDRIKDTGRRRKDGGRENRVVLRHRGPPGRRIERLLVRPQGLEVTGQGGALMSHQIETDH